MANFSIQSVVDTKTVALGGFTSNGKGNMRLAMRSDTGADGASFSVDALNKLKDSAKSTDGIVGNKVKGDLAGNAVEFDSSKGSLSIGGTTLKLGQGGFANALKDNLSVEKTATGTFTVNNLTNSTTATFDSSGNIVTKPESTYFDKNGKKLEDANDTTEGVDKSRTKVKDVAVITAGAAAPLANAVAINNSSSSVTASGTVSNLMINRAAGATIAGSSGSDKLFNLNASASAITGNGGSDSVYSVGLNSSASINLTGAAGDMSYVKLLGNMKGGKITMKGDTSLLDASGKTLNGVAVTGEGAASAVVANSLTNTGNIKLSAEQSAVDLRKLNQGSVDMGTGSNSVFIDSVTGNAAIKSKVTTAGEDTLRIKTLNNADVTQTGNKSSWMKLVSGMSNGTLTLGSNNNSIDAAKASFNKTSITQTGGTGGTAITAKSFMGNKTGMNAITLQGDGNEVSFSGTVQNANIQLGTGANTLAAGKIDNALIKAGTKDAASKEEQNITVKGSVNKLGYTGSTGDDNLQIGGSVGDSTLSLGDGTNSLTVLNSKGKGQNLTNVDINGSGSTTIQAGNIGTRGATGASTISLGGSSTVSLGNVGASTAIDLGTGANTLNVGAINGGKDAKKATINMGLNGTNSQTLTMLRSTKNANISFGSGTATVSSAGSIADSTLNLSSTSSAVTLKNAKGKEQALTNMVISAGSNSSTAITAMSLSSSGKASSSISLGGGTNTVSLAGTLGRNTSIDFGTGSNTLDAGSIKGSKNGKVNITVADGAANTTSVTTLTTRKGGASHLNYTGNSNADTLSFAGGVSNTSLDVGAGTNSITASKTGKKGAVLQALNNVTVVGATAGTGYGSSLEMNVGTLKGKSTLTLGGSNNVTLASVGAGVTIDLGLGSSSLTINKGISGGSAAGKQVTIRFGSEKDGTTSSATQNVTIKGNVKGLNYVGSTGDDTLKILGSLTASTVELGGGKNEMRVEDANSAGKTISNSTIKSTGENTTNSLTAGNVNTSGKNSNTVIDFSDGNAGVTLGNVSGNTRISTGTGSSTFTAGKFSGSKVSYTSSGYGSFIAGEISKNATVDFSKSATGAITIGTDGTGNGRTTPGGGINDATLKFGSNSVTLIAGGATNAETKDQGTKSMSNVNIEGSNATSFTVSGTNIAGKSNLNLGGTVSVTLTGSVGGTSKITTGTGAASITVKDLMGSNKDSRVVIDTSNSSSASMTVTEDASNFNFIGGTGSSALSFNTINQTTKRTSFGASINVSNAATGEVTTTQIVGKGRALTYTGSDTGTDHLKLGGEILNSTVNLGGGTNTVEGTNANTAAGSMVNTTISDGTGASTTMRLSSLTNSGSGTGKVDMKGALANVSFASTGTVTSDVSMNAAESNFTFAGTVGKDGSTKKTNITFGADVATGSLTFTGNTTNVDTGGKSAGSVTMSFTGGVHKNTTVNLAAGKGNTLNIDAEMNTLVANLGSKDGVTGANTVNVKSNAKFGADKAAASVTFTGAVTGGNSLNAGTNGITNMNLTSTGANLTVAATDLKNFKATIDDTKNSTFNVTAKAENVEIIGNKLPGAGVLTFGSGAGLAVDGLKINVGSSGALSVLAKSVKNADITAAGNITLGAGTNLDIITGVKLNSGKSDITVNATSFEDLDITGAKDVTLASANVTGALTVNATGNMAAAALVKAGNVNMTVGGTATLGGTTSTYESLSGTFGGKATILGTNVTSGGNITLKAADSSVGLSGKVNDLNVTNASAGKVTVGVADTTEFTGGKLANGGTGTSELEVLGDSVKGTIISGGLGKVTGDFSGSFTGTYIEGAAAGNTLKVGGTYTGSDLTNLNRTTLTAGTIATGLFINGGKATAEGLKANVTIYSGSLLVDNQKSGTITGKGDKANTLIAVGKQSSGAAITATGTQVQVGTAAGTITMSGASELIVNNVDATGKVKLLSADSGIAFGAVASGGNVDLFNRDNVKGFAAATGGELYQKDSRLTVGGQQLVTAGSSTAKIVVDKGLILTTFGQKATKATMPDGKVTETA